MRDASAATLGAALLIIAAAAISAQSAAPPNAEFEVASIKPNRSGDFRRAIGPGPGGRFQALNVTLRELVTFAYGVDMARAGLQIAGGPSWLDQEKFDVDAVAPGGSATPAQTREMVRALLAERFKLQAHRESREVPIYHLVMDRDDSRPGPRLRPSAIDCEARRAARRGGTPPPPPAGGPATPAAPTGPAARPICGMRQTSGRFSGDAATMNQLASGLAPMVGRIVLDRTGVSGYFDLDLEWTPDQRQPRPDDPPEVVVDINAPGIFTAIREQLGVRLQDARGPVDLVVIDAAERPTPD